MKERRGRISTFAVVESPAGGTIGMLIALTAIENNLSLLHNDRDFDAIAVMTPDLNILDALP